ncbi:hypothetical protein CO652_10390 [Rhizobium sp. H4]|nr:hypothetical protein CO652_10390 [Rhizobium sp. H4]
MMRSHLFPASPHRGEDARRADEGVERRSREELARKRKVTFAASARPLIRPVGHLLPEGRR